MQFREAGEFIYLHAVSKLISTYDLSCKYHNCQWGKKNGYRNKYVFYDLEAHNILF